MEPVGQKRRRGEIDDEAPPAKRAGRSRSSNHCYYCAFPLCSNRSGPGCSLSFHRFLSDGARKKAWIVAIRREVGKNFPPTSNTRVCSAHFKEEDYVKTLSIGTSMLVKRLVGDAIPSAFAWNNYGKQSPSRRVIVRPPPVECKRKVLSCDIDAPPSPGGIDVSCSAPSSDCSRVPPYLTMIISLPAHHPAIGIAGFWRRG